LAALLFCFTRDSGRLIIFRKRVRGLTEAGLASFVARAQRAVPLKGGVNILVSTNQELRRLNREFRGKNKGTDVLSFPAVENADDLAGDIAISAEIAAANAHNLGHTAAVEIKILALHGLLHLAGYDHERDNGQMARKEEELQNALSLPSVLISRSFLERNRRNGRARSTGRTARTR